MGRHERATSVLPGGTQLLLVSRVQAAALLNVSPSTFDKLRKANRLLTPVNLGARKLWPLKNLMAFVEELIEAEDGDDQWASATA